MFETSMLAYNPATKKVELFIFDTNTCENKITFVFKELEYKNVNKFIELGNNFIADIKKYMFGYSLNEIYFINRYLNALSNSLQKGE